METAIMAWTPTSFQPDQALDKNAVINDLYPQAIPSTDFAQNAGIPPVPVAQQPWTPKTFEAENIAPVVQHNQDPRLLERIGTDLGKREEQLRKSGDLQRSGQQSLPESVWQNVGTIAGGIGDVGGELAKSVYRSILKPEERGAISKAGEYLGETAPAVAAKEGIAQGMEALASFGESNPRLARNIKPVGQIISAYPALEGLGALKNVAGEGLETVGMGLAKSGAKAADKAKMDFVSDLILPKATPSVREDLVGRTKEVGLNRRQVVKLTPQEREIAETVSQISGVKKSNSLQGNANAIQEANLIEADKLASRLQENDISIDPAETAQTMNTVLEDLKKNPYISGTGETAATRVMAGLTEQLKNNPSTASGLLQARKDFDSWVKSQKGDKIFDAALDSPASIAVQRGRQAINDLVEAKTTPPTGEVLAGQKAHLDSMIDEYGKLKELETHLRNTVEGTAQFAGQQQGFWRRRTITQAAEDAKNLDNVKKQISSQEKLIKSAEDKINNAASTHVAVKESLRKQSNLYRAHEAIATKAKDEAATRIGRATQSLGKFATTKSALGGLVAAGGLGYVAPGIIASATPIGAGALAIYGAKKALQSPALRKGAGRALETFGRTIK